MSLFLSQVLSRSVATASRVLDHLIQPRTDPLTRPPEGLPEDVLVLARQWQSAYARLRLEHADRPGELAAATGQASRGLRSAVARFGADVPELAPHGRRHGDHESG